MPMGHVKTKLPWLFAPFPGANPRLLQTQRDSSLSSCLQTANQEQCLTVRNNYLASFALSTFQIQKGDKATLPMAQARSPSRRASSAAGSSLILGEMCLWQLGKGMRGTANALSPPPTNALSPPPHTPWGVLCIWSFLPDLFLSRGQCWLQMVL